MFSLVDRHKLPLLLLLLATTLAAPSAAQSSAAQRAEEAAAAAEFAAEVAEIAAEQAAEEEERAREAVEENFRILRLRDGLLLEPREDMDGIAAIEIQNGVVVIDGDTVSDAELEERLGEPADAVRRLAEIERERRRETFDGDAVVRPSRESRSERPSRSRRSRPSSRTDSQVVVGNSVVIEADEEARDVVVFGGRLTIRGLVIGDAVSIGGSVRLESGGEVTGDLAAIGGPATVEAGAEVKGDIISVGNDVRLSDDAIVGGKLVEVPFVPAISFGFSDDDWEWDWNADRWQSDYRGWGGLGRIFGIFWQFFAIVLWALLACLAYLLARGPVERMERKLRVEPWKAALVGLVAALLFLPVLFVVFIILLISIIGWLLLPLLPFAVMAVAIVAFLGGTAVALRLGRWTEETLGWKMVNPYVAIVVGVALIHVWSFVADILDLAPGPVWPFVMMFWFVGCVVQLAVLLLGLGTALLTRAGTQDDFSSEAAALPPIPTPAGPDPTYAQPVESTAAPEPEWDSGGGGGQQPWEPTVEPEVTTEPTPEPPGEPEGAGPDSASGDGTETERR